MAHNIAAVHIARTTASGMSGNGRHCPDGIELPVVPGKCRFLTDPAEPLWLSARKAETIFVWQTEYGALLKFMKLIKFAHVFRLCGRRLGTCDSQL